METESSFVELELNGFLALYGEEAIEALAGKVSDPNHRVTDLLALNFAYLAGRNMHRIGFFQIGDRTLWFAIPQSEIDTVTVAFARRLVRLKEQYRTIRGTGRSDTMHMVAIDAGLQFSGACVPLDSTYDVAALARCINMMLNESQKQSNEFQHGRASALSQVLSLIGKIDETAS